MKNDEESIRKIVEARKKEAESKGLKGLVEYLYEECKYYPSWIKLVPRNYVPNLVSVASAETSKGQYGEKKQKFHLKLPDGIVSFYLNETTSWAGTQYAEMGVCWNGEQVFGLNGTISIDNRSDSGWHSYGEIICYLPGEWELSLQNLKDAHLSRDLRDRKEDERMLNDLKKKFGI